MKKTGLFLIIIIAFSKTYSQRQNSYVSQILEDSNIEEFKEFNIPDKS